MIRLATALIMLVCCLVSTRPFALADHADHSFDRHIELDGQSNFRDIGGYQTSDGKVVKRGLVYRSGHLARLSEKDVQRLAQLKIMTVFNFLSDAEIQAAGQDRIPERCRVKHLPIETDDGLAKTILDARKSADFSNVPASLNPELHSILANEATEQYATLLRSVAATDEPLVYHCSHGIHRTGTATAILLWTLGVPWETIRTDYLLSNQYRKNEVDNRLEQFRQQAAKNQGIAPEQVDMTNFEAFYVLQGNYIDATREEILKRYGSIDAYLKRGLKLADDEIRSIRDRLLQDAP